MPDLLHLTKHPLHPVRLHTSINLPRGGYGKCNLFKSAHLSRDVSSTLGSHDTQLSIMNRVGNLTREAIDMIASLQSMLDAQGET